MTSADPGGPVALPVMTDPLDALVLDLLEWIGPDARPYAEVIDAWRTSCPRLPVWEEANTRGFIEHSHRDGAPACVSLSSAGRTALLARAMGQARARMDRGEPPGPEA